MARAARAAASTVLSAQQRASTADALSGIGTRLGLTLVRRGGGGSGGSGRHFVRVEPAVTHCNGLDCDKGQAASVAKPLLRW